VGIHAYLSYRKLIRQLVGRGTGGNELEDQVRQLNPERRVHSIPFVMGDRAVSSMTRQRLCQLS
jgi:hypothetical protein